MTEDREARLDSEKERAAEKTPGERDGRHRTVEYARLEVAGYLGRDAALVRAGEREFVSLSIGSSRAWRDEAGTLQERTLWVKLLAFGPAADAVRGLRKGSPVYAAGPLSYERWEGASGPRHAPLLRVSARVGDVQAAPMPGGQYTRVTVSGVIARDALVQRATQADHSRDVARFGVQARGGHVVVARGALVQHVEERLKTGHGVRLEGRLEVQRWRDEQDRPHERVTIVVGGPDSLLRVDRTPTPLPSPGPRPAVPSLDLPAPHPLRAPATMQRRH